MCVCVAGRQAPGVADGDQEEWVHASHISVRKIDHPTNFVEVEAV